MKKATVGQLRRLINEELARLHEDAAQYPGLLDQILRGLHGTDKTIEAAHEAAPSPESKTILVGLHQDLFNLISSFRTYIRKLKSQPG